MVEFSVRAVSVNAQRRSRNGFAANGGERRAVMSRLQNPGIAPEEAFLRPEKPQALRYESD